MPVRGSTEWLHARHDRAVINLDSGGDRHIPCVFADCDQDGRENHKIVQHEHLRHVHFDGRWLRGDSLCAAIDAGLIAGLHRTYVFCSERHKTAWLHSTGPRAQALADSNRGRVYGNLPTGYKGSML